jgi:FMN phosphatase YigB (HAD superfamily)
VKNKHKVENLNNKNLYERYGHTLIGLNKLEYDISIEEFNDFVYKDINYKVLLNNIKSTNKRDIDHFHKLEYYCKDRDIDMMICSNASDEWCHEISRAMGIRELPTTSSITNLLKPQPKFYKDIEISLNNNGDNEIIFVDDKLMNLRNLDWNCFLLSNNIMRFSNKLCMIEDLIDLCFLIR